MRRAPTGLRRPHGDRGPPHPARRWVLRAALALLLPLLGAYLLHSSPVGRTDYDRLHLRANELVDGQPMHLRMRKSKISSNCPGYGVATDVYFPRYGGEYCAQSSYKSVADFVDEQHFVAQVNVLYKLFSTEENAVDYYWRFWGTHMHEPLPSYVYGNITDSSPVVGEEPKVMLWDPLLSQTPLPLDVVEYHAKHIVYVFRTGRLFCKLTLSSFNHDSPAALTAELAARLAERVVKNAQLASPHPLTRRVRVAVDSVLHAVGTRLQAVLARMQLAVRSQASRALQQTTEWTEWAKLGVSQPSPSSPAHTELAVFSGSADLPAEEAEDEDLADAERDDAALKRLASEADGSMANASALGADDDQTLLDVTGLATAHPSSAGGGFGYASGFPAAASVESTYARPDWLLSAVAALTRLPSDTRTEQNMMIRYLLIMLGVVAMMLVGSVLETCLGREQRSKQSGAAASAEPRERRARLPSMGNSCPPSPTFVSC